MPQAPFPDSAQKMLRSIFTPASGLLRLIERASATSPVALMADGKIKSTPIGYAIVDCEHSDGRWTRERLPLHRDDANSVTTARTGTTGRSDIKRFILRKIECG